MQQNIEDLFLKESNRYTIIIRPNMSQLTKFWKKKHQN